MFNLCKRVLARFDLSNEKWTGNIGRCLVTRMYCVVEQKLVVVARVLLGYPRLALHREF
jgi:hypothetical protein